MTRMRACARQSRSRQLILALVALSLAVLVSCKKSKMDFWTQPAGPEEHLSPGFPEIAAQLYASVEQERQKLAAPDNEFYPLRATIDQRREETKKAVHSRVDRDLFFLLEGYDGKLNMLRNYPRIKNGVDYLPALHQQLDQCRAQLDWLFTTHPMPRPVVGPPLSPCLEKVPTARQ